MAATNNRPQNRMDKQFSAGIEKAIYKPSNDVPEPEYLEPEHSEHMEPEYSEIVEKTPISDPEVHVITKLEKSMEIYQLFFERPNNKARGVQKCVYFDADVYERLDTISQKYGVSFSKVLNLVLRNSF